MNTTLIRNWNSRVKPEDTIFIIGDFCFRNGPGGKPGEGIQTKSEYWQNKLNGNKIFLKGNHDKSNSTKTIIESLNITFSNYRIHMTHKPEHANLDYEINLVGHVHGAWKIKELKEEKYPHRSTILFNVGVDVNKFMPITLDEAIGQIIRFKKGIND